MQTFGLGAIMLLLPVSIWGWRMLTHRHFDREALRVAFWILAAVLCAGFASCLPRTGTWPLPTGLGGVTGDALLRLPASLIGADGFFTRLVLGARLRRRDRRDLPDRKRRRLAREAGGRGLRGRGRGRRGRRAGRTRIAPRDVARPDLARHAQPARAHRPLLLGPLHLARIRAARAPRVVPFDRREPTLGRAGPSIVPESVDEDDEDEEEEEEEDEEPQPAHRANARRARLRRSPQAASCCRRCRY